ncbi:MAG: oligosaccharide flippase family protein, partial [Patescibacteria group bacterium]
FARLQHAPTMLGRAIEKTLFGLALMIFPITVGLLFHIAPAVALIPRYSKWEPALISFYLLAVTSAIASLSVPLTNALNAVGKIKITLYLMVMWTVASWVLTVVLISLFGFNGVALAALLVVTSIVVVVTLVKKIAPFSFISSILYPFLGAFLMSLWYLLWRGGPPYNLGRMFLVGISGVILYLGVLTLMEKERIRSLMRDFLNLK